MPQKNMPADWQPPVDAWQSAFSSDLQEVMFGYFGCQHEGPNVPESFERQFLDAIDGPDAPSFVTRARYRDASGYDNELFIAYWPSWRSYQRWWTHGGYGGWFDDDARLGEPSGLWREVYRVPTDRLETLFSSRNPTGVATLGEALGEPVREHNYWGGMRDRVPASQHENFEGPGTAPMAPGRTGPSRAHRVIVDLPKNICLIRSGQSWGDCDPDELACYRDEVVPHLTAGMAFLRDNPEETGCISCRFMDELALDGSPSHQSFGLAAFISMEQLEAWARSHPTHLRIFNSFLAMVQRRPVPPRLKLWHEVLVTDQRGSACEYVNCHPLTGFLPFPDVTQSPPRQG